MTNAVLKKLKPLAAALAVAALLAAPVRPAHAWDEVCMHLRFGPTWFSGHLVVIHDFEPGPRGQIPTRVNTPHYRGEEVSAEQYWQDDPDILNNMDELGAHDQELSRQESDLRWSLPSILGRVHNYDAVRGAFDENAPPARGELFTGTILAGQTRCVSIGHLRRGEPFYVMLNVHGKSGPRHVVCGTHSSNRNWWYPQRSRPSSKIVWHASGSVGDPHCWYNNEE